MATSRRSVGPLSRYSEASQGAAPERIRRASRLKRRPPSRSSTPQSSCTDTIMPRLAATGQKAW